MRLVVMLLLAGACRSPAPAPAVPIPSVGSSSPTFRPARWYAGLFVEGARFKYRVEANRSYWDDQDPKADANGNVEEASSGTLECVVAEVRQLQAAIAASIECTEHGASIVRDGPAGYFVATEKGLFRVGAMPTAAPTAVDEMLFASAPVERRTNDPDLKNPGWGIETTVSPILDGWCRYDAWISGDEGDSELCIVGGVIASGGDSSSGGSSYASRFELVK